MSSESPITRDTPLRPAGSFSPYLRRVGPVSATLIGISILLTALTSLGGNESMLEHFLIGTDYEGLPEIARGEVWRLLTPIFLHFGLLHILFNMLWLKDLGTMVEFR